VGYFHYVNGKITTEEETHLSAFDLGIIRGYGVFDYVQLYKGRPFHLQSHLERLEKSAKGIGLEMPLTIEQIELAAWKVIETNEPVDAGLRFMITGGLSSKDFLIPDTTTSLIILFHPTESYPNKIYEKGMRAITTSTLRLYPHVKSNCYLPAIMAMREANRRGFHDAIYINEKNEVLEGTTCNVFFIKNDNLITDDSDLIIKGVTRDIILNLTKDLQIEFRSMPLSEIPSCDEAFLTSSIKDCVPLVQVNEEIVGSGRPGPITEMLRNRFHSYLQTTLLEEKQFARSI